MPVCPLPSRQIIRLSGEDALPFLQGLVTNDVMRLPAEGVQYAALLTPQGKFLFGFFLYWLDGAVLLDVQRERAEALMQRLKLYRLRSRVQIDATELRVAAAWGEAPALPAGATAFADPRSGLMGMRLVGAMEAGGDAAAYERMRLELGMPDEGCDLTPDKSFPLMFGFEAMGAVDFRKGCYVGQEVTARTKHLGQLRKFIYTVRGALPAQGEAVLQGDTRVGDMLSSMDGVGLALLQVEAAEQGLQFSCLGTDGSFSASVPSWLKNRPEA